MVRQIFSGVVSPLCALALCGASGCSDPSKPIGTDAAVPAGTSGQVDPRSSDPLFGPTWPMPNSVGADLPNPQAYEVLSDELVRDTVTGLIWQRRVPSEFYDWESAVAYCDELELGGASDWRLPSRIELVSLLSLEDLKPSIDGMAFPGAPADWFWSSTQAAEDENKAWYAYFYFGYPNTDTKTNSFSVRCVRFDGTEELPSERYTVEDDEVIDHMTGLIWQRGVSEDLFTFEESGQYCSELALREERWRLPSMQELQTIVDPRTAMPAIDATVFPATPPTSFWSSTPWTEAADRRGWHVDFSDGSALYLIGTTQFHARCVR